MNTGEKEFSRYSVMEAWSEEVTCVCTQAKGLKSCEPSDDKKAIVSDEEPDEVAKHPSNKDSL